jgi:hypothetical protein
MKNKKIMHFRPRTNRMKCECGEEILFLPDVRATSKVIEAHIELHMKGAKGPACTTLGAQRLRDSLIIQVLRIASRPEDKQSYE